MGTSARQTDSRKGSTVLGHGVFLTKPIMDSLLNLTRSLEHAALVSCTKLDIQ